ncbi:hypothetical protein SAMN05421827_12542 [Pedobacter terrae]|uniref:Uncharacterized protein n=1 Tax=Pedobacter terrae TaxID=405671 RepID=A0A1G8CLT8_9SPHI|nr:hypothetical protein SAMN05421827_12542 [Pedobacter terrae]
MTSPKKKLTAQTIFIFSSKKKEYFYDTVLTEPTNVTLTISYISILKIKKLFRMINLSYLTLSGSLK